MEENKDNNRGINGLNDYGVPNNDEKPNPKKGLLVALIFGLVGAILWAIIVKVTGYNLGIAAIVVGYLVSQGFVWAGKGDSAIWGVVAAVIATLSILIGKMLAIIILVAEYYGITFFEMMQVLDFGQLMRFMVNTFELFDLVFYAIALQTAYKRSFIQPSKNYADYMEVTSASETVTKAETSYESLDNSAFNETAYEDTGERAKRPIATPESEAR